MSAKFEPVVPLATVFRAKFVSHVLLEAYLVLTHHLLKDLGIKSGLTNDKDFPMASRSIQEAHESLELEASSKAVTIASTIFESDNTMLESSTFCKDSSPFLIGDAMASGLVKRRQIK